MTTNATVLVYDGRVGLHNVAETFQAGAEIGLSRIPLALGATLNENARIRTGYMTGSEIRFNLRGDHAAITLRMVEQPSLVELYNGTFFVDWYVIGTEPTRIEIAPPARLNLLRMLYQESKVGFDPELYRLMLPWKPEVRLVALEGDMQPPRRDQTPALRYLVYGSSISYGNSGIHPSGMYVQRTAQLLGVDLINIGFGGGAHLEPQMADYLASRDDWDFASLEFGINLMGEMVTEQEFARRVDYFINTLLSAHPEKPLFILDMFPYFADYEGDLALERRAIHFRAIVHEAIARYAGYRIIGVDALTMLTPATGLQADVLHPSPQGMEEIGTKLAAIMRPVLNL